MSWNLQLTITLAIVGLAIAYVGRSMWSIWAGKKTGCGSGCGKCAAPEPTTPDDRISLPLA